MNCSLKSDRHRYHSYSCVHIEVFHLIRLAETESLSHDRENLLHVQRIICRYMEIVWQIFVVAFGFGVSWVSWISWTSWISWGDRFPCTYRIFRLLPSRQVSLYLRPQMHLFCHPWELDVASWLRSLALGFPVLEQSVRQGALEYRWHFDAIGLFTQRRPGSSSPTLTLPRSCCLFFCSCILFAIVLVQLVKLKFWAQHRELKRLMLHKRRRLFHSSRVGLPLVKNVCEIMFGVDILALDLGVEIKSVKQPIKSNSVGPGYMSHCGTSAYENHFNHGFVILKDVLSHQIEKTSRSTGRRQHRSDHKSRAGLEPWFGFGCACLMWCYATGFSVLGLWCC